MIKKLEIITKNDLKINKKYLNYLEYDSIKIYLNGSIGAKSKAVKNQSSLIDKINSVSLSKYLLGVKYFLEEYSDKFNYPFEIVEYYDKIRSNSKEIMEFRQLIEDYTSWLLNVKGFSEGSAINYQSQLRGFLTWNNINLKFQNMDATSEKKKIQEKYGISFDILKEMSNRIIEYSTDKELKVFLKWLKVSGLGSKEIIKFTIGDLKHKNFDNEFIVLSKRRQKSNVKFKSFLYGDLKRDIKDFIDEQKELGKNDESFLFGEKIFDTNQIYNTLEHRFTSAYNRMIKEEYPQYKDVKKKVFTLHSFRHIFKTICRNLRIPLTYEKLFLAQKQDNLDESYILDVDLWKDFKLIQEEIHGIKQSTNEEEIMKRITENLLNVLSNGGKRKTIFNQYENALDDRDQDLSIDIYSNVLIEKIINVAIKEILNNPNHLMELAQKLNSL